MNAQSGNAVMDRMRLREVDVRDMLCAQALAVVAEAMARLQAGEDGLDVIMSTDDVRWDMEAWARQKHFSAEAVEPLRLRIRP